MNEWIDDLADVAARGEAAVVVTVAGIRGSAPREIGAKMIVTSTETIGTIGGGQLEYQCAHVAVGMLHGERMALRSFPLGPALGQCCGGVVEILFEPVPDGMPAWLRDLAALHGQRAAAMLVTHVSQSAPAKFVVTAGDVYGEGPANPGMVARARDMLAGHTAACRELQDLYEPIVAPDLNIAVFGAGHVGAAVVSMLSQLDCNIRWIDNRANIFRKVPGNVRAVATDNPVLEIAAMPPGSYYLIMTHSHALDFEICERVLRRDDAGYCGLIGSLTKRRRFVQRLRQQGVTDELLKRLTCPIGVEGISGKKPAEIAISVAAEILRRRERAAGSQTAYPDNVHPLVR